MNRSLPVRTARPWKHLTIGARLRDLRQKKNLSQGDIEHATGLVRCYISRIENGRTVPSLETLERFAAALDIPLYQLFYSPGEPLGPGSGLQRALEKTMSRQGKASPEARFLLTFTELCAGMSDFERKALLGLARRMATRV
jgi:transcriptional regulator with XRE-family HTH domain